MNIRERESKKSSVVGSMIGGVPKQKNEDPVIQRGYYLHKSTHQRLKILSAERGESVSQMVEMAIQEYWNL